MAFSANGTALDWLKERTPDLAMLDLVLSDGSTVGLARVLRDRAVPTLFLSGYDRSVPSDLDDLTWIEKPVSFDQLIGALTTLSNGLHPAVRRGVPRRVPSTPLATFEDLWPRCG